jgi:hypothetical protein
MDTRARVIDEQGEVLDRKAMLASIRPLPPGVSGVLRPVEFQATPPPPSSGGPTVAGTGSATSPTSSNVRRPD